MKHSLVSLGKKVAVYFLNSQLGPRLQGLNNTPLACGQGQGPVAVILGRVVLSAVARIVRESWVQISYPALTLPSEIIFVSPEFPEP